MKGQREGSVPVYIGIFLVGVSGVLKHLENKIHA